MTDAFYEPLGDGRFRSTVATTGPWDSRWQHGGPPSALVVRALEGMAPQREQLRTARVTVDILRPVPVAEVGVRTRVVRAGRQVELLEGVLEADGRDVLRVNAWRIAIGSAPAAADPGDPPPLPPDAPPVPWPGARTEGLLSAVEWRFASGPPGTLGPAQVWARPRVALVAGEQISPIGRVLVLADSGHGVSAVLDATRWLFINTDLTVLLHRHPAGEWVCLQARTVIDPEGIGMAETSISDQHGRLGRCLQTLLVTPRQTDGLARADASGTTSGRE